MQPPTPTKHTEYLHVAMIPYRVHIRQDFYCLVLEKPVLHPHASFLCYENQYTTIRQKCLMKIKVFVITCNF
jgi:hypothetical protein